MQPVSPKRGIDRMLLWICPVMVAVSFTIGILTQNDTDTVRIFAWQALFVELLLIYVPARRFMEKHGGERTFGLVPVSVPEIFWAFMVGAGAFFTSNALSGLTQLLLGFFNIDLTSLSVILPPVQGWRLIALIVLISVIPAYAEETLFRGALLHAWQNKGVKTALIHSSLLFALIHLQPHALPSLFFLGLILGAATLLTGSTYPAMIVHGVNNLFAVLIMNAAGEYATAELPSVDLLLPAIAINLFIGLSVGIPSYFGLKSFAKRRHERLAQEQPAASASPLPELSASAPERKNPYVFLTYALMLLLNAFVIVSLFIKIPGLGV